MNIQEESEKFIESQQSLHLYRNSQQAFVDVLGKMNEEEFYQVTKDLEIVALHEEAAAQVMTFDAKDKENIQILQLTIKKSYTPNDLRFIIAHELGHVLQKRNWKPADGDSLEIDADDFAHKLGFKRDTPPRNHPDLSIY